MSQKSNLAVNGKLGYLKPNQTLLHQVNWANLFWVCSVMSKKGVDSVNSMIVVNSVLWLAHTQTKCFIK